MARAETIKAATTILCKILPPAEGCDRKTYKAYVEKTLAGDDVTLDEIATLLVYYNCGLPELVNVIVRDRMKGG